MQAALTNICKTMGHSQELTEFYGTMVNAVIKS